MPKDIPKPSARQQAALSLYADLMGELKIRVGWIDHAVLGRTGMAAQIVREFCYLQLRLCCELVALACLVAHGDIEATQTTKFQTASGADTIIKGLQNLNADAFPNPVVMRELAPHHHHLDNRPEGDWMTKAELLDLYGRVCGSALHKGSLKNLMKPRPPIQKLFPEISVPTQRLMNLVGVHKIALDSGHKHFLCLLGQHGEAVRMILVQSNASLGLPESP